MTSLAPRVSIVILNWNSSPDTIDCLESVLRIDYPNYAVVVVDNGSADSSVEEITRWLRQRGLGYTFLDYSESRRDVAFGVPKETASPSHQNVTVIESGENLGHTGGNNVGIRYALERGADYVLILNDDTTVSHDFLSQMMATAEKDPKVGLVGCKILALKEPSTVLYEGGNLNVWLGFYGRFRKTSSNRRTGEMEVNFVPGCALLVKRAVFEESGLFDEKYFLYAEDVEFCYRALKAGWRAKVNLDALIWHRAVPPRGQRSLAYYYYGTRNFLYLISHHLGGFQRVCCFLFFASGRLLLVLQWLYRGQYDHIRATWQGVRDYLRRVNGRKDSPLACSDEGVHVAA